MEFNGQPDHGELMQSVPPPQTVRGIMNSIGAPFLNKNTADLLDLDLLMSRKHLIFKELSTFKDHSVYYPITLMNVPVATSKLLFLAASKISGTPIVTLWMNKPQGVTGLFCVEMCYRGHESKDQKGPKIMWDIATTDNISFPMNPVTLYDSRSTTQQSDNNEIFRPVSTFGISTMKIRIQNVNPIEPGSLFPDSYTIYGFVHYENFKAYNPRSVLQDREKVTI